MAPRPPRHSRASSVPSSPTRTPAKLTSTRSDSSTVAATTTTPGPAPRSSLNDTPTANIASRASLLHPRVAVVLNVPRPWHLWLFALRLSSILPAAWWGTPSALRLLLRLLELVVRSENADGRGGGGVYQDDPLVPLTETALAAIWCFASGYLSFFFTDCLMSRWLINYTPQATMVRLLTINAVNAYITSKFLSLAGGFQDPRLLLPGWIGIATTLTVCYHITHQKINIRKETSTSVNVFSIASYISMITLLAYMHVYQPEYPPIPVVQQAHHIWNETRRVASQVRDSLEQYKEL